MISFSNSFDCAHFFSKEFLKSHSIFFCFFLFLVCVYMYLCFRFRLKINGNRIYEDYVIRTRPENSIIGETTKKHTFVYFGRTALWRRRIDKVVPLNSFQLLLVEINKFAPHPAYPNDLVLSEETKKVFYIVRGSVQRVVPILKSRLTTIIYI